MAIPNWAVVAVDVCCDQDTERSHIRVASCSTRSPSQQRRPTHSHMSPLLEVTHRRYHQKLPVQAAIEGPAACFRLLEIDDGRGMQHEQFVRLLMSATDNRFVWWCAVEMNGVKRYGSAAVRCSAVRVCGYGRTSARYTVK